MKAEPGEILDPFSEFTIERLTFGGELLPGGLESALAPDDPERLRQDLEDLADLEEAEAAAAAEVVVFK